MVSHEMQADTKKLTAELTGTAQERASIAKTIELERYAVKGQTKAAIQMLHACSNDSGVHVSAGSNSSGTARKWMQL